MRAVVDSTESEIRVILTPEQRGEFDRMREEGRKLGLKQHSPTDSSAAGASR
jgi:hypothetical protein